MNARAFVPSVVRFAVVGLGAACSADDDYDGYRRPLPECAVTRVAADTEEANDLLEDAEPGTCVMLQGKGVFEGPFVVPPGVALLGLPTKIVGSPGSSGPTLILSEGSRASRVRIDEAPGVGIAVRAASAHLEFVTVNRAARAAIAVTCDASRAPCEDGTITLTNVSVTDSGTGLWVSGAHVVVDTGDIRGSNGTYPGGGAGIIAVNGARLDAMTTGVASSAWIGVLLDGERTKATFRGSGVGNSGDHNVYVQGVRGTVDTPAVAFADFSISGAPIGLGAFDSSGIVLIRTKALDSRPAGGYALSIVASGGSTDLVFDRCALPAHEGPPRPAAIIHDAVRGRIEFLNEPRDPGPRPKVVVQGARGAELVLSEVDVMDVPGPLPVRDGRLAIPSEP